MFKISRRNSCLIDSHFPGELLRIHSEMDVIWEYKGADNDKAMEEGKKPNGSDKGIQTTVLMSSKVYKKMRSVATQTEHSVTVGTQTEVDFLMMADALSDSLVVECSESDDHDEDEGHDSLF